MPRNCLIFLLTVSNLIAMTSFADDPAVLCSREIILHYQAANTAPVNDVEIWVRADDAPWTRAVVSSIGPFAVAYKAPRDGNYSFYIILENEKGQSAPPPSEHSLPHLRAVVDTLPPTLQIHGVARPDPGGEQRCVRLAVSLIDENLGEKGVRLFYRVNAESGWIDAGPVASLNGTVVWRPPPDAPPFVDIRLMAIDLAGNRALDEIRDVSIPAALETPIAEDAPVRSLAPVLPLEPVTVEPVRFASFEDAAPPAAPDPLALRQAEMARQLQEQGTEFLKQGRLSLAGTRLQDSLEFAPDQPNTLVDLGNVYFREQQYDLADAQFTHALKTNPDHLGALEGQALVAMTQKRYPEARSHMQRLLKLSPDDADHWLHMGDVEHMLGRRVEARAAWNKALQLDSTDKLIREEANKRLSVFGSD